MSWPDARSLSMYSTFSPDTPSVSCTKPSGPEIVTTLPPSSFTFCTPRDVAEARHGHELAGEIGLLLSQHFLRKIDHAEARRSGRSASHPSRPLPVSTPVNSFLRCLYWPNRKPISRPPTPMSPAARWLAPMWRNSSVMKLWQKCITSVSLFPFGSKSLPPSPPPMGSVVSAFLNTCSKARNFEDAEVHRRVEAQPALVRADGAVHLDAEAAVDLDLAVVITHGTREQDHTLRLDHRSTMRAALYPDAGRARAQRVDDFYARPEFLGSAGFWALTFSMMASTYAFPVRFLSDVYERAPAMDDRSLRTYLGSASCMKSSEEQVTTGTSRATALEIRDPSDGAARRAIRQSLAATSGVRGSRCAGYVC